MGGMEVPIAMGAISGFGSYLGGSRPSQAEIAGYGGEGYYGLDPQRLMKGATEDLGRLGALYAQRAATPISMPSSYVQPLPMFKGGIVDRFATGLDPALPRPELLTRSGVNFGNEASLPFQGQDDQVAQGGRKIYQSSVQSPPPAPTFGGAHSGLDDMQKALSMLRPADPEGRSGQQNFDDYLFTGARGARTMADIGSDITGNTTEQGKGLISDQASIYSQAGYPTRRTGSTKTV